MIKKIFMGLKRCLSCYGTGNAPNGGKCKSCGGSGWR